MDKVKVLIAIDEPEFAKDIVHNACSLIDLKNSEITLLNVDEITLAEDEYFYREPQKFIRHEAEKADYAYLEDYLEKLDSVYKGFLYKEGNASKIILDIASNENYDLIVVGSHNKHSIVRLFLGSVSHHIVRHSKCSVLIIKPISLAIDLNSPYSVLFAVDGSEYSEFASNNIGKYLDKNRANINILNVTLPIQEIIPSEAYVYTDIARIMEEANLVAQDIIRGAAINVARQRLTVNKKYYANGDPASTIISESQKNGDDLVIVGSHGESGIPEWLIGSVSSKVYEYSKLPVIIIKR